MRKDFRFCGSGGQGIISMVMLLANAYGMQKDYEVAQTQSYGPAARGGACKAELVVSDEKIDYVKADRLNALVCMNRASFEKFKQDILPETVLFADSTFIGKEEALGAGAGKVYLFPATRHAEERFRVVCANVVMMGYFIAKSPELSLEDGEAAIRAAMNPKLVELNLKALRFGYEQGKEEDGSL